ncbi:MAG TPA: esterase [Verrucomicrobiales bacterium]|nr:esterase [Verrucomicrobiales bacterium]
MRGLISGFGSSFLSTLSSIATALEYLTFIDMKYRLVILILTFGVAFAAPKLRRVNDVDYVGDANPRQTLDLYIPETKTESPRPVILWIHGGAWRQGSKDRPRRALKAAGLNCAIVSINYRLTSEKSWPAQIHDCKAALRWVKAHAKKYHLDADRIVVWGASAGGHLVTFMGTTQNHPNLDGKLGSHTDQSTSVKAVINFFGPTDFLVMNHQGSSMDHNAASSPEGQLLGGEVSALKARAKLASPFHQVSKDDAPILTVHGTRDPLVPYLQGKALDEKLDDLKVSSVLLTVSDGGHGRGFGPSVDEAVIKFLKHHFFDEQLRLEDSSVKENQ